MKTIKIFLICLCFNPSVWASNHFESTLSKQYPQFDITDTFIFPTQDHKGTIFAVSFDPNSVSSSVLDNLSDNCIYALHIKTKDGVSSYLFSRKNGEVEVNKTKRYQVDDPTLGAYKIGVLKKNSPTLIDRHTRAWVGLINDPFFSDANGFRTLVSSIKESDNLDVSLLRKKPEFYPNRPTTEIVFEKYNDERGDEVEVFSTSLIYSDGHWHQISYSENILLTNLFLLHGNNEIE